MGSATVRRWRPGWPCPPGLVLAQLRHGPGDPSFRTAPDGTIWRAVPTPAGGATIAISPLLDGEILARAWGDGAAWALEALPRMLGADDDPSGFVPRHPVIARLWRQFSSWRLGATGLLMESLVPVIIEQKVTGAEAFSGYRRLVQRYGEPAPGAPPELRLQLPPSPAQLLAIPSWEWLRLGIDHGRSAPLLRAAQVAPALERAAGRGPAELDRCLRTIRGIGIWTSAEVRARVLGDADAVSFGDFHIAGNVGYALTGTPTDDAGMAELLAPYAPHRHRVQRLIELGGVHRPRRGARMAPRTHLPVPR
ncbi:DNA-3-methyladenine glycosylase family protein [Pseudactinotalea terrae]|uniref:DNA-3-methyladenine glycosylase family protein n=1 Tax=Pseudactinotalea terrae TaxID=1743262 RepID=UPI0012E10B37|nr:DNA-3-methyladenine glycosylase 2 family protein [Pseudactinotalea terrae]